MERKKLMYIVLMAALSGASIALGILDTFSRVKKLRELIDNNSIPDLESGHEVIDDESPFTYE